MMISLFSQHKADTNVILHRACRPHHLQIIQTVRLICLSYAKQKYSIGYFSAFDIIL